MFGTSEKRVANREARRERVATARVKARDKNARSVGLTLSATGRALKQIALAEQLVAEQQETNRLLTELVLTLGRTQQFPPTGPALGRHGR